MGKQSRRKRDAHHGRTQLGLLAEVLAAASGRPVDAVGGMLAAFRAAHPGLGDRPLAEAEYQAQKARLMADLPGVRAWLAQGAARAAADPARVSEIERRSSERN